MFTDVIVLFRAKELVVFGCYLHKLSLFVGDKKISDEMVYLDILKSVGYIYGTALLDEHNCKYTSDNFNCIFVISASSFSFDAFLANLQISL